MSNSSSERGPTHLLELYKEFNPYAFWLRLSFQSLEDMSEGEVVKEMKERGDEEGKRKNQSDPK